jgi:hypothetical protein
MQHRNRGRLLSVLVSLKGQSVRRAARPLNTAGGTPNSFASELPNIARGDRIPCKRSKPPPEP